MSLKHSTLFIFSFIYFSFSSLAGANNVQNLQKKMEVYDSLATKMMKLCTDPKNGKFLSNAVIKDEAGRSIDCDEQLKALKEHHLKLENEYKASLEKEQKACEEAVSPLKDLSGIALAAANNLECPGKQESTTDCLISVQCNAFSSLFPPLAMANKGIYSAASKNYQKLGLDIEKSTSLQVLKKCGSVENSCLTSILRGIFDSLFTSVDGMWQIVKLAGKGLNLLGGKIGISLYDLFHDVEDTTSEKMMAAQQLSDADVSLSKSDPLAFVSKLANSIYLSLQESIKQHYGCEKWSGVPYTSECIVPMQNWECGTCNQRMNVICGVGGFAAGEIVTAFLTGGTVAAIMN